MSNRDIDELSDSLLSSSSNSTECSICLESLNKDDIAYMDCGHSYHFNCIGSWMHYKKYHEIPCPLCNNIDSEIIDIKKGSDKSEINYETIVDNNFDRIDTSIESNIDTNQEIPKSPENKSKKCFLLKCICFF